jgi:hypothetical protein
MRLAVWPAHTYSIWDCAPGSGNYLQTTFRFRSRQGLRWGWRNSAVGWQAVKRNSYVLTRDFKLFGYIICEKWANPQTYLQEIA